MANIFRSPRIFILLFLGFSSGLPLALTGSTLQAWFTQAGISVVTVGMLTLVGLPYMWKFLWSPILDRFVPPWGGRRRGWIAITQISLCILIFIVAQLNPIKEPLFIGSIAILIAFVSASQDVAIDAYRTDVLLPEERGPAMAIYIFAYRMAILISGGLALIAADYLGWKITYEIMAVLMGLCIFATYYAPEIGGHIVPPKSFVAAVVEPFTDFFQRNAVVLIICFIIFYKIGDALAQSLLSNFLLKGLGFSLTDVGVGYKSSYLIGSILGAFMGGALLMRFNLYRALMLFGIAQAFSNLMFVLLAMVGKNYPTMVLSIFIETFCSGMSTTAFFAFITGLCHVKYSATQFAFYVALASIGRIVLGPLAGWYVSHFGWVNLFIFSFIMSFPGLIFLSMLRSKVNFNAQLAEC